MTWNTIDIVNKAGGTPIQCKTGHAFIKERMRAENAIYGGEMSAHHCFRDFAYCDSGMIPWLLIAELLSTKRKPLSKLVDDRINAYPCSGEINCKVENTQVAIETVLYHFEGLDPQVDNTDGISLGFLTGVSASMHQTLNLYYASMLNQGAIRRQLNNALQKSKS